MNIKLIYFSFSVFFFLPFVVFANEDISFCVSKNNVTVEYINIRGEDEEIYRKCAILVDLVDKLCLTLGYRENVYVFYRKPYRRSKSIYKLGFGSFCICRSSPMQSKEKKGVKLSIRAQNIDYEKALNMLVFALSNSGYVQENQKKYEGKWDPLSYALEDSLVNIGVSLSSETVSILLKEKTFGNVGQNQEDIEPYSNYPYSRSTLDFYYQNKNFCFFLPRNSNRKFIRKEGRYFTTVIKGEALLSIPSVTKVLGKEYGGFLVAENDSIFYFLDIHSDKLVSGPFKIDNVLETRFRFLECEYDGQPKRKFFLKHRDRKVAFLPDEKIVIQDYDIQENKLIQSLINGKEVNGNMKVERRNNIVDSKFLLLALILVMSMILNIIFFIKRK